MFCLLPVLAIQYRMVSKALFVHRVGIIIIIIMQSDMGSDTRQPGMVYNRWQGRACASWQGVHRQTDMLACILLLIRSMSTYSNLSNSPVDDVTFPVDTIQKTILMTQIANQDAQLQHVCSQHSYFVLLSERGQYRPWWS